MPKNVDVPGVGVVEFPDDMADSDVEAALKKHSTPEFEAPRLSLPRDVIPADQLSPTEKALYEKNLQRERDPLSIKPIGRFFDAAGRFLASEAADFGSEITGRNVMHPEENLQETAGKSAVQQLVEGETISPPPDMHELPTPLRMAGRAGQGLLESAPRVAAVAGAQMLGVPAPVAAGAVFGTTAEGFDPKQAAIAAALPFIGKYSGEISGLVAKNLGVSNETAIELVRGLGATAGPAAPLIAQGEYEISKLPEDKQKDARIELYANIAGQLALGPMGLEKGEPTKAAGKIPVEFRTVKRNLDAIQMSEPEARGYTGREGVEAVQRKYSLSRDEAVEVLSRERKRLGISKELPAQPPTERGQDAVKDTETEEVHATVPPQPGESQQAVPVEGGGPGVRGPAEAEKGKVPLIEQVEKATPDQLMAIAKSTGGITKNAYRLGENIKTEDIPRLEQAQKDASAERDRIMQEASDAKTPDEKIAAFQKGMAASMKHQWFGEAIRWRKALDEAQATGAKTIKEFAEIEKKHGVGSPTPERAGHELMQTAQRQARQKQLSPAEAHSTATTTGGTPKPEAPTLTRDEPKVTKEPAVTVNESGDVTKASIPERAVQTLEEHANRARQRLARARQATFYGSGPLHELPNIRDFAIIGASKIARGTLEFGKWSAEMITEFGEQIRPYLANIWDSARGIVNETVVGEEAPKTEVQRIIERGVGMEPTGTGEKLGLAIPAVKVEELTGVKPPEQKKITVGEKTALKEVLQKSEAAGEAGRKAGRAEAHEEAKGIIGALKERLAESVSKARALTEYFRGREKGGAEGREAATKESEMADRWLEADSRNIADSLTKLVNKSLPPAERGRFIRAITGAMARPEIGTTEVTVGAKRKKVGNKFVTLQPGERVSVAEAMYRRAADVAARIEYRADEVHKQNTIDEIKQIVERATKSPSVDVEYKKQIEALTKRMGFSRLSAEREAKLRGTKEYVEKHGAESLPDEVVSELDLLNKVPAQDLPIQVLEAIRDRMDLLEQLGRLKVKSRGEAWNSEKSALVEQMKSEDSVKMEEHPELRPQPGEKATFSLRLRNFINRRLNSIANIDRGISPRDVMLDLLDGAKASYRGFMSRTFGGRIDSAFNRMIVRRDAVLEPVQAYGREQKFTDQNYERIGAYAIMQQEGGRERLIQNGADPAVLDRINSTITPAEKKMYGMMREAMDKLLPEVQSLMRNLYNVDVKPVLNYFPLQREWRLFEPTKEGKPLKVGKGEEVEYDELATWKSLEQDYTPRPTTKTERGFTIERLPDAGTPIKVHALDIFMRHVQDVSHLLETQRDLKMLGEITRDDPFKGSYGQVGQKYVLDWLDTVARQGGTEAFRRLAILDALRRNTTLGVIGFRLSSQFVHLANVPLAMNQSGFGWYFKGAHDAMTPEGQAFIKKHFAETFARAGAEPAIEEAKYARFLGVPVGKLAEPAFWIVRHIDRLNSQATALGIYQKLLSEKGVNPENYHSIPIDEAARNEALIRTRRAVASPLPKDVPQALSRGSITGGNVSVGRALLQFQNVFLDQWSVARHDLVRAGIKGGNPKMAAQTMAALGAMVLIETGIKMGFQGLTHAVTGYQPKHPVDFEEKLVHESLRRFPFMGNILAMSMYGESGIPAIDAVVQVVRAAGTTVRGKTEKTKVKGGIQAVSGALQIGGVPGASQVGEFVEKGIQ